MNEIYVNLAKDQVTVVIPTLNEAEGIAQVLDEVEKEGYRNILVVEGYSNDKTAEKANQNGVKVIYQHGPGKAGAIRTAIEHVQTPYMLFMDGDCTYDPNDIWRLLNHADHYSHVIGTRTKQHIPRVHRLGNWVISQTFRALFGVRISDVCSGMYLLETEEARKYKLQKAGFIVEIELAACSAANENVTEVPISYRPRVGQGKLSTWQGFSILFAAFPLARQYNPILFYSSLAALSMIPAMMICGWVALQQLTTGIWHSGWILLGVMLLLMATQAGTLASMSIMTRHSEERLLRELRKAKSTS
jgi:dolichol-phosphate mannosyltransferase